MYLLDTLYYIYKKEKRDVLFHSSKTIAKNNKGKSRLFILLDMIFCSLKYGAMFSEYAELDFVNRSNANRKTYITTFYNFKLYDKINHKAYRDKLHDKSIFLKQFDDLVNRDWMYLNDSDEKAIFEFIRMHKVIVLKDSYGNSGNEVEVVNTSDFSNAGELVRYMESKGYDLIEEKLCNHLDIAKYNESSLNTIRIVTVNCNNKVSYLFAGIRIGSEGATIDNLSQGGAVARINISTGKIETGFFRKREMGGFVDNKNQYSPIGDSIPYWSEVLEMAQIAAKKIPEIGIVAWDICITPNGPEIIEGNESFGSVVMQLYNSPEEEGLKPSLERIIGVSE